MSCYPLPSFLISVFVGCLARQKQRGGETMRQLIISVRRLAAAASAAGTSVLVLPSQQQGTKLAVRTIASSAVAYIKSSTTCSLAQTATLAQGVKMLDSRKPFTEDFFFRQVSSYIYVYLSLSSLESAAFFGRTTNIGRQNRSALGLTRVITFMVEVIMKSME